MATNRTPLFVRRQPGGVLSIIDVPAHPGNIFFVDSGSTTGGDTSGFGQSPDSPFLTIDFAVGQCTASNGDVIYVMPGHAESLTAAAAIAADVAGISIIGVGVGNTRPVITFASTDNAATWTVSANNVKIRNVVLVCNDDALTNALVVSGDNCEIDIEFQDTSAAVETATAVRLDTANNCKLKLKYLGFTAGNAVVSAVRLDDCDNVSIDIDAYGVVTTAWVEMVDVASTNVSVRGRMYTQGITNFTRDVVDTITGSTWDATIFDSSAGSTVSGGSAAALAADDISALATSAALAVVDEFHDVPAANNVLNAQMNEVIGNKTDTAASGAVTATDTLVGYVKQLVTELAVVDEFHDVPAADNVLNVQMNEVIGNKTDAAASGAVTATDTLVGYIKQLVTELAIVDEFHDVPLADNVLNAQINEVIGNKTDAAASGVVTATDTLVGYIKQLVTELAVVDEFHDVPAADNVLNAQINEVIGNKTDAAAAGAVTATDTLVGYIKQLVTELAVVDEFHDVPLADNVLNAQINEVIGNKTDAAASGAVTATDTLVGYIKQLVTELAVIDEFHDVPAANNALNAQINEVIGNKTDAAAAGAVTATDTLVGYAKQLVNVGLGQEISIQKVQTTPSGGADALFTITGGPIFVRKIVGIVTTVLVNVANGTLQATVTEPAGTVALSTTVAIDNDAAGTSYRFIGATGVLTPVTAGAVRVDPVTTADCEFLVPIGNINFLTSAAMTGAITWYMSYVPLSPLSTVVAA